MQATESLERANRHFIKQLIAYNKIVGYFSMKKFGKFMGGGKFVARIDVE